VGESFFKGNQLPADSRIIDFTQQAARPDTNTPWRGALLKIMRGQRITSQRTAAAESPIGSVGGRIYPRGKIFPQSVAAGGTSTLGRVIQFGGDSWLSVCILSARAGESRNFMARRVKIQPVCQKPDARARPALEKLAKICQANSEGWLIHGTQIAADDR
jgi:hypothetical protein